MAFERKRTAAAIDEIFFFHSTRCEDLMDWFDISTTEYLCINRYSVLVPPPHKGRESSAPRIVRLLQFLRYDGPPPLPLDSVRLSLHDELFAAAPPHLDKGGLDDGAIEIERRDALGRARGEMDAVQTTAGRTEGRREPPKGLLLVLGAIASRFALFEDWID
jgi:hypothetical protein